MTVPFVVWDLDGTLIDSMQDIANAANAARADLGRQPLPEEVIRSYVGEGAARLMDQAIGVHEPAEVRKAALDRFFIRYEMALCVHTRAYPGIETIVRRLEGHQAIATNKPGHFARRIVDQLGWGGMFKAVVGGGEVPRRKPAPDAVLKALELSGARMENAVFVGDTPIDINTAAAAGIRFVCVSWGLRPRSELRDASVIVDSAEELERALFQFGGP
jgi:phosphoglycolate phosphatase